MTSERIDTMDLGPTARRWLRALGRRRPRSPRQYTFWAAGLVVALALVFLVPAWSMPAPAKTVSEYLEAIADGDAERAMALAKTVNAVDDNSFLNSDALTTDWTVTDLITRTVDSQTAYVFATIEADDGTSAQGRFVVRQTGQEEWRIDNPYVKVIFDSVATTSIWLNDVRSDRRNGASEPVIFTLFPGVYRLFPNSPVDTTPGRLLLMPTESAVQNVTFDFTTTEQAQAQAQQSVNDLVDSCAQSGDAGPKHCPFAAQTESGDHIEIEDDLFVTDLQDSTWEVITYPQIELTDHRMVIVTKVPGVVRLTGTGERIFSDESGRIDLDLECDVDSAAIHIDIAEDGTLQAAVASERLYPPTCGL